MSTASAVRLILWLAAAAALQCCLADLLTTVVSTSRVASVQDKEGWRLPDSITPTRQAASLTSEVTPGIKVAAVTLPTRVTEFTGFSEGAAVADVDELSVQLPRELTEQPVAEVATAQVLEGDSAAWYNATQCPLWVSQYITFHKQAKNLPSTKYLLYKCFEGGCHFGLGDRLRALEFMFRLASTLQRVLLIDIPRPAPLETFFTPGTFDWTMTGITLPPLKETYEVMNNNDKELMNGTLDSIDHSFIVVHGTNLNHCSPVKGGPDMEWSGLLPHCIFRALFKPARRIQQAADAMLTDMGVKPGQPFTAVHVRIGGSIGEGRINRNDELSALHHSIRCGQALAASHKLQNQPMVLITDNIEVKKMILEGAFAPNIKTTTQMPIWFGAAGKAASSFVSTVAEMGVLARSTCLVAGFGGGFGLQARLWGEQTLWAVDGSGCYTPTENCIEEGKKSYELA